MRLYVNYLELFRIIWNIPNYFELFFFFWFFPVFLFDLFWIILNYSFFSIWDMGKNTSSCVDSFAWERREYHLRGAWVQKWRRWAVQEKEGGDTRAVERHDVLPESQRDQRDHVLQPGLHPQHGLGEHFVGGRFHQEFHRQIFELNIKYGTNYIFSSLSFSL